MHSEPQADCILIIDALMSQNSQMMRGELHLLAYMSCLLHLYDGGSVSDWGYTFYGTEDGAPFSDELESAFQSLVDAGSIIPKGESFIALPHLSRVATAISTLEAFAHRRACVSGSMASICYFGSGIVREALEQEPELRRARSAGTQRKLLIEEGLESLYFHFQFIKERLPRMEDLRASSVLWISSLYETKRLGAVV
ncbi:MAG: hypothetical protein KF824_05415 [Fimbriimonadaceae bacterium]|nr:MAG: hypothetical protein KF824_05415 [Fimbriimonadaceae bacterium]